MSIKQRRLAQLNVAASTPTARPDQSLETAIRGFGRLAATGAQIAGAREAAEEAAGIQQKVSEMEDAILDVTLEGLGAQQDITRGLKEEGIEVTDEQRNTLSRAQQEAARIDAMERQTGNTDEATILRAKLFRQFKKDLPIAAPELRQFFKQYTGQSVIESLIDVEQDRQKSAEAERAALQANLRKNLDNLGIVHAGMTTPQMFAAVAPYEQEIHRAALAEQQATTLKNLKTIRHEERLHQEELIADMGLKGTIINNLMSISTLLSEFDYQESTPQEREALLQELNLQDQSFRVQMGETFQQMDVTERIAPVLKAYETAREAVQGQVTLEDMETSNKIIRESAMSDLNAMEGFPDLLARLQTFRNIPGELIVGKQRTTFSADMVQPMLQMLAWGMQKPTANPYGSLEATASPRQLANQYKALAATAINELDNKDAAKNLTDALQAWTNQFTVAPNEIPLEVYDAMLDVAEKPGAINLFKNANVLPDNLRTGFKEFDRRLKASLTEDLTEDLATKIDIVKPGEEAKPRPVEMGLLTFIPDESIVGRPKVAETLTMKVNGDGSLTWAPRNVPAIRNSPEVNRKAQQLNREYGKIFGKLARAYAHLVQGNNSYSTAAAALLQSKEWEQLILEVGPGVGVPGEGETE